MVNKSIAFIGNYQKTYFFSSIALELEKKHAIKVYWITPNLKYKAFLEQNFPKEQILLINKEYFRDQNEPVGDLKINELVYNDRVLRNHKKDGHRYLQNIQQPIYNFIKQNSISYIFGEVTWAHEQLIHRICSRFKELNCQYLYPDTVRIPNGKYVFFTNEGQKDFIKRVSQKADSDTSELQESKKLEKPDYLKSNDLLLGELNSFKGILIRIYRLLTNYYHEPMDPSRPGKMELIKFRVRQIWNKYTYKLVKTTDPSTIKDKFILVPLHVAPEASLDVFGRYYEDQFQNIINIWRALPPDWKILVKDHTNALGCRKVSFYKKLQKYPGIIICDEKADSHALIKASECVITVSGTVALEALLMDELSFTFADMYFTGYGKCYQLSLDEIKNYPDFEALIKAKSAIEQTSVDTYKTMIENNSFPGFIGDPLWNAKCMEPDNINNLTNSIVEVISSPD